MNSRKNSSAMPAQDGSSPQTPTSFETLVKNLKLSPEEYATSATVREWVRVNKDQKYVPPELLKALGLDVE